MRGPTANAKAVRVKNQNCGPAEQASYWIAGSGSKARPKAYYRSRFLPASAAATAAACATATITTTAFFRGAIFGFVDLQPTTVDFFVIECADGFICRLIFHFDEAETA